MSSKFIAVEGLDLAGKTSVILPYLQKILNPNETLFLADMKTGNISKGIRNIFMDPESVTKKTDWVTIAMLASAARSDMVYQDIIPAIENNKNVICDRFVDTSFVYNKESHDPIVKNILDSSTHGMWPDVIIFAYCSYEEMIRRKCLRDDNDQWDLNGKEEYDLKLQRYKDRLYRNGLHKVYEIDSSSGFDYVYQRLDEIVKELNLQ